MQGNKKSAYSYASLLLLTLVIGISSLTVQSQTVYADSGDQGKLLTIYHTYLDDEYLGSTKDRSIVTQYINDKIEEKNENADGYTYGYDQELNFIPERVFYEDSNVDQLLAELDQVLEIDIKATTLQFGDRTLGHFASEEEAEQALYEYKSLYVDEEILDRLSENEDQDVELEVGESTIVDVTLSEEVTTSESIVSEDELLTVKEAVELLEKGTLEELIHEVSEGDTLYSIAKEYNLSEDQLLDLNKGLDVDDFLQLDQELNVTDYVPFVDVIVYEEELKEKTIKFEQKTEKSDELYRGDSKKKQAGQDGKKEVHLARKKVNGQTVDTEILDEEVLKEVQHEIMIEGTKVIPSRGTGDFAWPAVGGYISSQYGSRWGSMHKGIDIAGPSNRNIVASDNGTVEKVSNDANGYGNYIVINHNNGYKTLYAHLASTSVNVGQTVPKGTEIGVMGTTGRSTGIHLHFEVIKNGSNINPMDAL